MGQVDDDLVGDWEIDPAHSRIGFSARHAMVTKVRGAFNDVEGRIHVSPDGPAHSSVVIRLAAASVDTRHNQRDTHLRSADFFDVERYPEIVFRSTRIEEVEPRMYMVRGGLTIRGITREVAIPIELRGVGRGTDGELRAGFEGTRRVDRREWGLEWQVPLDTGGVLVSERVTMEFEISVVKVPQTPERPAAAPAPAAVTTTTPAPAVHQPPASATDRPSPSGTDRPPATAPLPSRRARHRAEAGWLNRLRGRW